MMDTMVLKQDKRLDIRATAEDLERWQAAAEADGRTLSSWIRWHLNAASAAVKPTKATKRGGKQ